MSLPQLVVVSGASLILLAGMAAWIHGVRRLLSGRSLLPWTPRREPRWGLLDVAMTGLLFLACQLVAVAAIQGIYGHEPVAEAMSLAGDEPASPLQARIQAVQILASSLATLAACLLSLGIVAWRSGARLATDLGFTLSRAGEDVAMGVIAFVMLAPLVYSIQGLLVHWFPSRHPLIEYFEQNPSFDIFLLCGFSAVAVAPIAEEGLFRVLLQGWLERFSSGESTIEQILFGGQPASLPGSELAEGESAAGETLRLEVEGYVEPTRPLAVLPIVTSALLFALMHWSHGPDPVPLFVLAIGLGYLYQRTHRVLPCIVLHLLLNGCSMAVLGLSILERS